MKLKLEPITIMIVIAALVIGFAASRISKTPDSPIEEVSEELIERSLYLPDGSIDLSPNSPE